MKLTIELNDNDIKRAIDQQVAALIAQMTTESITAQVAQILNVKFDRVTNDVVMKAVNDAATSAVTRVCSRGFGDGVVREALASAAMQLLKEKR